MNEVDLWRGVDDAPFESSNATRAAPPGAALTRRGALRLAAAGLVGLSAGPAFAGGFTHTVTPMATHVVVSKPLRVLELRRAGVVIKRYRVSLGFAPEGHKSRSGDGRTPEGRYWIDRRNPRSDYHLSLGINYPNADDIARAEAMGVDPGGDIFIHGEPTRRRKRVSRDWTAGCIAVRNREMEEIWSLTPTGVPVTILA